MKALKLGLVIGIVAAAVYLVSMLVPPYFNNYRFDDWIAGESFRGSYWTGKPEAEIRQAVITKAREFDINLRPEQLRVEVEGRTTRINVNYTVRVDLPFYPIDLHFTPGRETKVIKGL